MRAVEVCLVGDLRLPSEGAWRAALAAEALHRIGVEVALQHLPFDESGHGRDPGAQLAALAARGVRILRPGDRVAARLAILCGGERFPRDALPLQETAPTGRVLAERVVVTVEGLGNPARLARARHAASLLYGEAVTFAAGTREDLDTLAGYRLAVVEAPMPTAIAPAPARPSPGGLVGAVLPARPPESALAGLEGALAALGNRFRLLTQAGGALATEGRARDWQVFGAGEIGWDRFLSSLSALLDLEGAAGSTPRHAIAWCRAQGVPVLAWDPEADAAERFAPSRLAAARAEAERQATAAKAQVDAASLRAWIEALVPLGAPRRRRPAAPPPRRTVLFVTSNGVGMGHVTRALSIARRLPAPWVPVFATASQAVEPLLRSGYAVEYLPFHGNLRGNADRWHAWMRRHVQHLLATWRPAAVVFDGAHPYAGLIGGLAAHRDFPMVWVRRGMWRAHHGTSGQFERARLFDLVIEPRDIAEAMDQGPTLGHPAIRACDPIRLLDEHELLGRAEARRALGLRQSGPACLVQLNAGNTRDNVETFVRVKAALDRIPGLEICLAHWLIGSGELTAFEGVRHVSAFPLSAFFAAFDFVVSAAGYNSFNELISFAKPAVFLPDEHTTMDDQGARAAYAEARGAAFNVTRDRLPHLPTIVDALRSAALRRDMSRNARALALPNGAEDACRTVLELIRAPGRAQP